MLSVLFILLFGVHIGQEYPNLPSIKRLTVAGVKYFTNELHKDDNKDDNKDDKKNFYRYMSDFFQVQKN